AAENAKAAHNVQLTPELAQQVKTSSRKSSP
ncbi:hypothetical protein LCGC14_2307690, partial [marine sediment metagenome]